MSDDKYPFWVNRIGALCTIAVGVVTFLTPWRPALDLHFYSWWLKREAERQSESGS